MSIQLKMGKDQGDALPFFYPLMINLKELWDEQLADRTKGYCGVSHAFALRANAKLWAKWEKFAHPLDAAACKAPRRPHVDEHPQGTSLRSAVAPRNRDRAH